ncbi:MAG: hypothetical protein JXM72_03205 [Deltaproteobacteria bacterium]|nr:hypothetical protein [Deltaproteobacteria bacterium]
MSVEKCELCGRNDAVAGCDGCGKRLCKRCRSLEIYTEQAGEITVKCFCSECKSDPGLNPQGKHEKIFGLEDITEMVNQDQTNSNRFRIKLKIS